MILAVIEISDNLVKKSSMELAYFASKLGESIKLPVKAIAVGSASEESLSAIGQAGVSEVLYASAPDASIEDILETLTAQSEQAQVVLFSKSNISDNIAGRLAVRIKAGLVPNVMELPSVSGSDLEVKSSIYTGKAFVKGSLVASKKVLVVKKNAIQVNYTQAVAKIAPISLQKAGSVPKVLEVQKTTGDVLLTEAEIVVSGGRGMKGPEHWHHIEGLAKALRAATGCSKPVSDMDWRPHHEHVGQTGVKVSPNLYIAVGISGAIQHLAGVNSSKCIVVINKDPEAPFFKAADYGIVGDAFEVLPKLTAVASKYI